MIVPLECGGGDALTTAGGTPALRSGSLRSGFEDFGQQVWFGVVADQVGVQFAAVVVEFVGLEIVGIFDQEFDRGGGVLSTFEGIAENIGREAAAVHRDQLHAGTNAGFGGEFAFDGVADAAIIAQFETQGESGRDDVEHTCHAAQHIRRSVVVGELPSAAFDAAEGRAGAVIGEALGPEAAPVVGNDLIEGVNDVVEGVSLQRRAGARGAVEEVAEIVNRFLAFALLADDDINP